MDIYRLEQHLKKKIVVITLVSLKILLDLHLHQFVLMSEVRRNSLYFHSIFFYQVPPIINVPLEEIQVEIGEQVQLTCKVDGSPKPHLMYKEFSFQIFVTFILFSWYHNNTERQLQSDDRSTMILNNVQQHHVGIYTCFASNLFGNASADIHLIVTSMLRNKIL